MVVIVPSRDAVDKVVEIIKCQSAKVRKEIGWFDKSYYDTPSLWPVEYFVSTTGPDEEMIKICSVSAKAGFRPS